MKKIWYLLFLVLVSAAVLTGCASSADNSLATPTPSATGLVDGMLPGLTATNAPNNSGIATSQPMVTGAPANNGAANTGIQTPQDARKAAQDMEEAIERLSEVKEAHVIALGDTALVGLEFGPEYQGQVDDRMKKMVLARVQTVDKSIRSVAVTADVKWMQDIQAMGEALGSATGLDDVRAQMEELVKQITPYSE